METEQELKNEIARLKEINVRLVNELNSARGLIRQQQNTIQDLARRPVHVTVKRERSYDVPDWPGIL